MLTWNLGSPNLKAMLLMSYDYLRLYTNAFAFHATIRRALPEGENGKPSFSRVFYNNVGAVGDARFIYEGLDAAKSLLTTMNNFVDAERYVLISGFKRALLTFFTKNAAVHAPQVLPLHSIRWCLPVSCAFSRCHGTGRGILGQKDDPADSHSTPKIRSWREPSRKQIFAAIKAALGQSRSEVSQGATIFTVTCHA